MERLERIADMLLSGAISPDEAMAQCMTLRVPRLATGKRAARKQSYDGDNWGLSLGAPIGAPPVTGQFVSYPVTDRRACFNTVDCRADAEGRAVTVLGASMPPRPCRGNFRSKDNPIVRSSKIQGRYHRGALSPDYEIRTRADRIRQAQTALERSRQIILGAMEAEGASAEVLAFVRAIPLPA